MKMKVEPVAGSKADDSEAKQDVQAPAQERSAFDDVDMDGEEGKATINGSKHDPSGFKVTRDFSCEHESDQVVSPVAL